MRRNKDLFAAVGGWQILHRRGSPEAVDCGGVYAEFSVCLCHWKCIGQVRTGRADATGRDSMMGYYLA
jgi:hypothetical protein